MEEITCSKCKEIKPIADYYTSCKTRCKECIKTYTKNRYHGIIQEKIPKLTKEEKFQQIKENARNARLIIKQRSENTKRLPDREIYSLDSSCENRFYLDFSYLKDIPVERLSMEYWQSFNEWNDKQRLQEAEKMMKEYSKQRRLSQYERKTR